MPETILHHYQLSPYSEKIRPALGLKALSWRSVEIPVWTPRPKLTPMTGGIAGRRSFNSARSSTATPF
jgi:glutathione S-transferase